MPQCQFQFSAVFVFQKRCTRNILRIAWEKFPVPLNHVTKTVPEGHLKGGRQVARRHPGVAQPWPAPGCCLGPPGRPRLRLFAHIIFVSGKPYAPERKSTKSSTSAVIEEPISGGF